MNSNNVGIIGAGRLGSALARRLPSRLDLRIADRIAERAIKVARQTGNRAQTVDEVFRDASILLLTIPSAEVIPLVQTCRALLRPGSWLINMATGLPTQEIRAVVDNPSVRVIAVKPIVQAYRFAQGSKAVFVVADEDASTLRRLSDLFGNLGPCVPGDEMLVHDINAAATRAALRLVLDLQRQLEMLGATAEMIQTALHTVAVGTILDYPNPDPNPYIHERLKELLKDESLTSFRDVEIQAAGSI